MKWLVVLSLFAMCLYESQAQTLIETITGNAANTCNPGLCPYVGRVVPDVKGHYPFDNEKEPLSLCGNLCTHDSHCGQGKKCCPTTCGYVCRNPVFHHY